MVQTTSQLFSRISELNGYEMVCVTVSARNSVGEGPRSAQTCARALETGVSHITHTQLLFMFSSQLQEKYHNSHMVASVPPLLPCPGIFLNNPMESY